MGGSWRIIFGRRRDRGVASVSSLVLTRVGVYVGVGVCIRTRTHTLHTLWGTQVQARGRDETPGGPEESRRTKSRHMCIRICVQSLYMFVYAKRRDEILD